MMFEYCGINAEGKRVKSNIIAVSAEDAKVMLDRCGIKSLIYCRYSNKKSYYNFFYKRSSFSESLNAIESILKLYMSGLSIVESIEFYALFITTRSQIKYACLRIRKSMINGQTFYQAAKAHGHVFNQIFIILAESYEVATKNTIPSCIEYFKKSQALSGKIKRAIFFFLSYNIATLFVGFGIWAFTAKQIVFMSKDYAFDVPQSIVQIDNFFSLLSKAKYYLIASFIAICVLMTFQKIRNFLFVIMLKIKIIRDPWFNINSSMAMFIMHLGSLNSSDLVATIRDAAEFHQSQYWSKQINAAIKYIENGENLIETMIMLNIIDYPGSKILQMGMKSNDLPSSFKLLSDVLIIKSESMINVLSKSLQGFGYLIMMAYMLATNFAIIYPLSETLGKLDI